MADNKSLQGYSRALFDIACDEGIEAECYQHLKTMQTFCQDDLVALVENPVFSDDEKKEVLVALAEKAKFPQDAKAFFVLVALNGRLRRLPEIIAQYRVLLLKKQGKQLMQIRTAVPLDDAQTKRFKETFESMVDGEIEVETKIDKSLIGGAIVELAGKSYDGSVRGRIQKLKTEIGQMELQS